MPADHEQHEGEAAILDKKEQGALDMLLKNHYEPVPPEGYFDTFWASVDEKIEEGIDGAKATDAVAGASKAKAAKGASSDAEEDDGDAVFKSSPALEALRIPEPRRSSRTTGLVAAVSASATSEAAAATPPPEPSGAYRWPVAFVLAAAIGVGGILIYKKSSESIRLPPPSVTPTLSSARPSAPADDGDASVSKGDAVVLAAVTPGAGGDSARGAQDPGSAMPGEGTAAGATTSGAKHRGAKHGDRAARHHARRTKAGAKASKRDAPKKVVASPKAKAKARAKARGSKPAPAKGGGDLDSLLDNALGKNGAKKPKKAAVPAKPKGPTTLDKNQIRASMKKLNSRVGGCYDKYQVEGVARVKLTITRDGRAKNIKIRGKFFGTDTGACVKKAVKGVRFPKFTGKERTITYPFRLAE